MYSHICLSACVIRASAALEHAYHVRNKDEAVYRDSAEAYSASGCGTEVFY